MMKRLSICLALLLSLSVFAEAQDFGLEVQNDKKVLFMDRVNLPPSTSIYEIIHMLPELLSRDGVSLESNYAVKVNDMPVDEVFDAIVGQLRLSDVEKIEICESASDSYVKGGESGSINIILVKHDKDLYGNMTLDAGYPLDIMPGLMLGSLKGKWRVYGLLKADCYDPSSTTMHITSNTGIDRTVEKDSRYFNQVGRVYAEYRNSNDELDINVGESSKDGSVLDNGINTRDKSLLAQGHIKYKHIFSPVSDIEVEGDGSFMPKAAFSGTSYTNQIGNSAATHIEYGRELLSGENAMLKMILGANYDYSHTDIIQSSETSNHVMPYAKLESKAGKWNFLGEIDWHYIDMYGSKADRQGHGDFTGLFSASFHFTPQKMLRLLTDAKIVRQNDLTLDPIKVYSATLDYLASGSAPKGGWMTNLGAGYIHVADVFPSGTLVYDNSRIWKLDALAQYTYGVATVGLTGNLYSARRFYGKDLAASGVYGNTTLRCSLNFKNDIHATAAVTYNSKVFFQHSDYGDTCCLRFVLGKNWGKLDAHIYGLLNLTGETTDTSYSGNVITYTTYLLQRNSIGVGLKYSF